MGESRGRKRLMLGAGYLVAAGTTAACSLLAVDPWPSPDGGVDAAADAPPPPDAAEASVCVAAQPDTKSGVFVVAAGDAGAPWTTACTGEDGGVPADAGVDASACSQSQPCSDIREAICVLAADPGKKYVYLTGTAPFLGSVRIDGFTDRAIVVQGGWNDTFTEHCDATSGQRRVTLQGDDGEPAVSITQFSSVTLESMDIHAGQAPDGGSAYGVFASDTRDAGVPTLTLTGVSVMVPNGSDGMEGTSGQAGTTGSSAGCSVASDGGAGADGDAGAAGTLGTFDELGYHPAAAGAGDPGAKGNNGTAGGPAGPALCCTTDCGAIPLSTQAGPAGRSGCAGGGGGAGGGGTGGGASIAVYAWSVSLTAGSVKLEAADGGLGGQGGAGGDGGVGSNGVSGTETDCDGYFAEAGSCANSCTVVTFVKSPGGVAGGAAGSGGAGGTGGDGFAGPSCALVTNTDALFTASTCTAVPLPGSACDGRDGLAKDFGCK
jgi:hypothetical protein